MFAKSNYSLTFSRRKILYMDLPGFSVPQSVLSLILLDFLILTHKLHPHVHTHFRRIHRHTRETVAGSCKVHSCSTAVYLIRVSVCLSVFHSHTQLVVLCWLEHCVPLSINQDEKAVFHTLTSRHPFVLKTHPNTKRHTPFLFSLFCSRSEVWSPVAVSSGDLCLESVWIVSVARCSGHYTDSVMVSYHKNLQH